ncbi:MAG: Uma2 family endonuclease [Cyanobacteria bacterium J06621_11]
MASVTRQLTRKSNLSVADQELLPTMYDLPSEFPEEPGLPDEFHDYQPQLLSRALSLPDYTEDNYFTGSDLNVYYDVENPGWHKRPDWFLSVDVPRLYRNEDLRRSYVTWDEGQTPAVIVEFISPNTEKEDLGRFYRDDDKVSADPTEKGAVSLTSTSPIESKKIESKKSDDETTKPPRKFIVYEQYLQTAHYIVYSRYSQRLRYFKHVGTGYEEQPINDQAPLIWLSDLKIGLALWDDYFEGLPGPWLRWCDADGNWLLTDTEQAEQKTERLAAKLRELGINPDEL